MEIAAQTIQEPGELPTGVDLWFLSPKFSTKRYRSPEKFAEYVDGLVDRSAPDANLILWIRVWNFADNQFWYPTFNQWIRHGVILSGSGNRTEMGVVFSRSIESRWRMKAIWSEGGGPKCSHTCSWVVRKICSGDKKLICDPYAKSHHLAMWCRRLNVEYRGYTRYQGVRDKIEKELAQLEFPGIQEELPHLMSGE